MTASTLQPIDHTGLKTGTALTLILLVIAFVMDSWLLVALVALCQLCGALQLPFAPYRLAYQRIVKPMGIAQPHVINDNMAPHRFSMALGTLFNGVGALLLATVGNVGWVLVGIVFVLANLQFWLNFCAGCWLYYQLNRLGVAGFDKQPPLEV
jgi:hypothetical protein